MQTHVHYTNIILFYARCCEEGKKVHTYLYAPYLTCVCVPMTKKDCFTINKGNKYVYKHKEKNYTIEKK